jgi:hypothetical protein
MTSFQTQNQTKPAFGSNPGGLFFGQQNSNANNLQQNRNRFFNNRNNQNRSFGHKNQNKPTHIPNTEFFRCEFCSVGSMTKFCYEQHCASQKHLKKVALANTLPSTATSSNVTDSVKNAAPNSLMEISLNEIKKSESTNQLNESAINKLAMNSVSADQNVSATSQPKQIPNSNYKCEICKIDGMSKSAYDMHLIGQKHRKVLVSLGIAPAEVPAQTTASSLLAEASIDLANPPFIKKVGSLIRCELCDISSITNDQFQSHLVGRKHQKKVIQYAAIEAARANSTLVNVNISMIFEHHFLNKTFISKLLF